MTGFTNRRTYEGHNVHRENAFRRVLRKGTGLISGVLIGATTVSGISCSNDKQAKAQHEEPRLVKQVSKTDSTGQATFIVNGRKYSFSAFDSKTGDPIDDLFIIFYLKGDAGVYIVLDSQQRYTAQIVGVDASLRSTDQSIKQAQTSDETVTATNVVLTPHVVFCSEGGEFLTQSMTPEELFGKGEGGLKEMGFVRQETVKLSELGDRLKNLIELAVGESAGYGAEEATIWASLKLGFTQAANAVKKASGVLTVFEICDFLETDTWANYYRTLCYAEADDFEIWKWEATDLVFDTNSIPFTSPDENLIDLGGETIGDFRLSLLSNPIFIVLPTRKESPDGGQITEAPQDWTPPTGTVDGTVNVSGSLSHERRYPITVSLDHTNPGLFNSQYSLSTSLIAGDEQKFTFVASACDKHAPMYNLVFDYSDYVYPEFHRDARTPIYIEDGDAYGVTFQLNAEDASCQQSVQFADVDADSSGNKYKIFISCEQQQGYISTDNRDCNDSDAAINPSAEEICDEKDNDCDGFTDNIVIDGVASGWCENDEVARPCRPGRPSVRGEVLAEPVLHLTFNEGSGTVTSDKSGQGNDGTFSETGVSWTSAGKIGGAVSFDGTGAITVSDNPAFNPVDELTLAAWVNPSEDVINLASPAVLRRISEPPITGYSFGLISYFSQEVHPAGSVAPLSPPDPVNPYIYDPDVSIQADRWYHIAFVRESCRYTLYTNGVAGASRDWEGAITSLPADIVLGSGYPRNSDSFIGLIDDVRVYTTALTPAEIVMLFNNGAGTEDTMPRMP